MIWTQEELSEEGEFGYDVSHMFTFPKEMIQAYVQRRVEEIALLESGSLEEFNRIGHQLAGNSRNFGFEDLEQIALKMEKLTAQDLELQGPQLVEQFRSWVYARQSELSA